MSDARTNSRPWQGLLNYGTLYLNFPFSSLRVLEVNADDFIVSNRDCCTHTEHNPDSAIFYLRQLHMIA